MFSERLKQLRIGRKQSQQQMADFLGITRQGYAKYENGSSPDIDTLNKLANFFDVSVDYLLGRSPEPRLSEQEYLQSIIKNDDKFKEFTFSNDGEVYDLEQMLEFLKDKQLSWGEDILEGEERRRAVEVLKALFSVKKDT